MEKTGVGRDVQPVVCSPPSHRDHRGFCFFAHREKAIGKKDTLLEKGMVLPSETRLIFSLAGISRQVKEN